MIMNRHFYVYVKTEFWLRFSCPWIFTYLREAAKSYTNGGQAIKA